MNFSLNSDDPLVCHTTKDLEEKIAINKIGLSPAEITRAVSLLGVSKRTIMSSGYVEI